MVMTDKIRIWSREPGSAVVPSRVSLLILYTHAESGAYSRDSSRFPRRRRPFIYTANRHRNYPEFIGSLNYVPMAFTAESPPAQTGPPAVLKLVPVTNRCYLFRFHHMDQLMRVSLFPHALLVGSGNVRYRIKYRSVGQRGLLMVVAHRAVMML